MAATKDAGGYVEGAILRVYLENFLTYDSCEIRPGPHLNMIIGPNTSGKSSIVCAICLGLAGKTSFLGRAQQPSEFIKHGAPKATIEITLYNPSGENNVIRRDISRPNKSEWSIGGRPATQKAVEELTLKLNVQMGNLCQFLPQDKVADFAKMTQQELLDNTEKAAGPAGMFENHSKLKSAREKSRTLENSLKNTTEVLEREKQKNARLETDVKNYQARQKHLEQIKILKMKRAWVEYEDRRKQYQQEKIAKDELWERLKKAKAEHAPLKRRIEQAQDNIRAMVAEIKKTSDMVKDHARSAADKSKAIDKESDLTQEAQDELKARRLQESKRRKTLADLKHHLKTLQDELTGVVESENVQEEIEKCVQSIKKTNQEMNSLNHKGEGLRGEISGMKKDITALQNQLKKVQDLSNQRLDMLRHRHKDTYEAVLWLRQNHQRFNKKIHEPLMLIINVNEPRFAKYVEGHISFNDMKAFVCEDPADMESFLKAIRDEQGLQVNAVMAPTDGLDKFKPAMDLHNLGPFGFNHYLRDLFDCPAGVMAYLCKLYAVHNVPVGNAHTKENVQMVTSQLPQLSRFYTLNHSYTIKRSRYAGGISTRCTEIKKAQLLTVILDDQREKQLKKDLAERTAQLVAKEQEYRDLQATHRQLETRMNQLRIEKKALFEKKDLRQSLTQRINMKQQNIARLEKDAVDLDRETLLCKKKIDKINSKKMKLMKELRDHTLICQKTSFDKVRASLNQAVYIYQQTSLENEMREKSQNLTALERECDQAKDKLKETKDLARRLLTQAHKATGTSPNEELSPQMTQAFSVLPTTIEEIDANIHEETARAECTYNTDEQVVEEYNRRKRDIQRHQTELEQRDDALHRHQAEVEEIKAQWLGPLQDLIQRIDKNFSHFFSNMKCAGEVDLNVPENPEDYEKYGVRIKVKYRDNEQLRELTPHHQSGGERSVATVLYMMALQELTKCPFRCVDEINQGMDPQNERKVFELVVKTACRRDTSQYFLLTPKLLPDLAYGDRMTILCVYNGPKMVNHQDWNLKKFIRRRNRITE